VRSARFAGEGASDEENLALLIESLRGHEDRRVAYVCVLAFVVPGEEDLVVEGRCEGELVDEPRGTGGFGYDPAFVPSATGPDDKRTMAELDPSEKHAISHRGRAARELAKALRERR
jgi:XTP/dITP diphosphohydrolase